MKRDRRTLTIIGIILGGLAVIAAIVIPLWIVPSFNQRSIEDDINYRMGEIVNKIENAKYGDALDRCEKTYEEVYELNSEYKKKYYHCRIQIYEGVCYINIGKITNDGNIIENGIDKEREILDLVSFTDGKILHAWAYYELGIGYWNLSMLNNPIENMITSVESFEECMDITTRYDEGDIHNKTKQKLHQSRERLKNLVEK